MLFLQEYNAQCLGDCVRNVIFSLPVPPSRITFFAYCRLVAYVGYRFLPLEVCENWSRENRRLLCCSIINARNRALSDGHAYWSTHVITCVSGWPPDPFPLQKQLALGLDLPVGAPPEPPLKGRDSGSEQPI